jgi:rubredoxin
MYSAYVCLICGWIYDEEFGCSEEGIPAGTKWSDIPNSWVCPECGVGKQDFSMLEL